MPTLLDELGGREAVEMVVVAFYDRVLRDPNLRHFFREVSMSRLQRHQIDFFCMAFGGGDVYRGRDIGAVHAGMAISDADFNAVAGHLVGALNDLSVPAHLIEKVIALVAPLRSVVVTRRLEAEPGAPPQKRPSWIRRLFSRKRPEAQI